MYLYSLLPSSRMLHVIFAGIMCSLAVASAAPRMSTHDDWMPHWQGVHGKGTAVSTAPEVLVVTGQAAVGFVFMASAMLLLLFFFMNHIFAVVLVRSFSGSPLLHPGCPCCFQHVAP